MDIAASALKPDFGRNLIYSSRNIFIEAKPLVLSFTGTFLHSRRQWHFGGKGTSNSWAAASAANLLDYYWPAAICVY